MLFWIFFFETKSSSLILARVFICMSKNNDISPLKYDFYKFDNQFLVKCILTTRGGKLI